MKRTALATLALTACLSVPEPPASKTHHWKELAGANQPGKLHGARMTWDDERKSIVLFGGVVDNRPVATTWQLDATMNVWTPICPTAMPPMHAPAFAYDPIGKQLVLAGGSPMEDFTSPTTNVWTCSSTAQVPTWVQQTTSLPRPAVGAQLVFDGTRMLLVGGNDAPNNYARDTLASAGLQTWVPLGPATPASFGGSASNVTYDTTNNRILALKNYTKPFGDKADATDELWELRASSDHWALVCGPTQKGCAWEPRSEASLAYLAATDSTFAIGGAGGNPRHEFKGAWILDDNEFIHSHDDPPARDFASMSYDPERKRIVVYGGNGVGCAGDCDGTWILESD